MSMSRYKKRGWFGESHRHYLASKGISTKPKRFFAETAFGRGIESFGRELDVRRKRLAGGADVFVQRRLAQARAEAKAPSLRGLTQQQRREAMVSGLTPDEAALKKSVLVSAGIGATQIQRAVARAHEFDEVVADNIISRLDGRKERVENRINELTAESRAKAVAPELSPEQQQSVKKEYDLRIEDEMKNLDVVKKDIQLYERLRRVWEEEGVEKVLSNPKDRFAAGRAVMEWDKLKAREGRGFVVSRMPQIPEDEL